jgi:two-component system sensor histidine kinase BaeS
LKLRIIHKGLILLLLPFLLQTGLFATLMSLINGGEALALKQQAQVTALNRITVLIVDFGDAWTSIFNHVFAPTMAAEQSLSPEQFYQRVTGVMNELTALPHYGQTLSTYLADIKEVRDTQYALLKRISEENSDGNNLNILRVMSQLKSSKPQLFKLMRKMNYLKQVMEKEQLAIANTMQEENQKRSTIKNLMIAVFIVQLVLTTGLLMYFLRDISKRLSSLVTNARQLPDEKTLTEKVGGDDEIAYLDSVLHQASDKLKEAAQNRKSVLNMIAHDIRSPLMSSKLLIDNLLDSPVESQRKSTGDSLRHTFKQVLTLVEDLLSIEKLESGRIALDFDMIETDKLAQSVLESLAVQASHAGVILRNEATPLQVVCDSGRIAQVLTNFVSNAIKHSPPGGTVTVLCSQLPQAISFNVIDEGNGLSKKDASRVFDKFFQAEAASGANKAGFGLGLAVAAMLIKQHGGEVGVNTTLGEGCDFWFTLPVDEDE